MHQTSYLGNPLGEMDLFAVRMRIVAALHVLDRVSDHDRITRHYRTILPYYHNVLATAHQTNVADAHGNAQLENFDISGCIPPTAATDIPSIDFPNLGGRVRLEVPFLVQFLRVRSPALCSILHLPQKPGVFSFHLCLQIGAVHSLNILLQVCNDFANSLIG